MPISKAIREKMISGTVTQIAGQAKKDGMVDLRTAGIEKVKQGIISLAELNRVISEEDKKL
jgi:type IV pilus assembly protein PilB